jgi:hypothetical protein
MHMAWLQPSTLLLVAINLVPLIGIYAWGWDGFVLLMLYWLETASIAFWTIVRIAAMPRDEVGRPFLIAAFISVHAGLFMIVHLVFLWVLFSGQWSEKVHGIHDFISQLVIGTGMWLPLLVLFIGRGLVMLYEMVQPALLRRAGIKAPIVADTSSSLDSGILSGLYIRIVVMQITIILGGWIVILFGGRGTLALVIAIKTAVDLAITRRGERGRPRTRT